MRAVRIHDWGAKPRVDVVAVPRPAPGEALVRVDAAAIGHLDRTVMSGTFGMKPSLPYIGGVEGAGTVVSGTGVPEGTRVMVRGGGLGLARDGTWAQYVRTPEKRLTVLPDGMPAPLGATYFVPLTTAAVALRSIGRLGSWGPISASDEVVVVAGAAGAVGSMVTQLAIRDGAHVIGLVRDEEQAARLPAEVSPMLPTDTAELARLGKDRPATLLVDTLGGPRLLERAGWVQPGGRVALIGYVTGEQVTVDLPNWLLADVALLPTNMIRRDQEARQTAEALGPLLVSGELHLEVEEFPFEGAARALRLLETGQLRGRAVLSPPRG